MTTSSVVRVSVGQFAPGENATENLDEIGVLAGLAARSGSDLLVLPEYCSYSPRTIGSELVVHSEPTNGPFTNAICDIASRFNLSIVLGIVEKIPEKPRAYNTLVFVDRVGSIVGCYRKIHLYDSFGARESDWIAPGPTDAFDTFEVNGLRFGAQTCYDLRFPEVTRSLCDAGVDVVLLPARWFPGPMKEDHWTTLVRARAIESTVFVAAADQSPPGGSGLSMIVDPMGVTMASMGDETGVAISDLSYERLKKVRAANPSLNLRRFSTMPNTQGVAPSSV